MLETGIHLKLIPELRQEQMLEQRLALEQKLEERLEQQIELHITLEQYLYQEDLIKGFIRWANEHKSWEEFNQDGFSFSYVALPYKIAEPIADKAGLGFSHCFYDPFEVLINGKKSALAKGDWTLFVVKDQIPPKLVDFVALHERGEELSLGDHYFASRLEFAYTKKRNMLREYTQWIDETMPSKFVDLTQKIVFPILPEELSELLKQRRLRKKQEHEMAIAEKLIGRCPLQTSVLRLMDNYNKATKKVVKLIDQKIGYAQKEVYNLLYNRADAFTPKAVKEAANLVNKILYETITSIDHREARVISRVSVDEVLENFSKLVGGEVHKYTQRHISIPVNFELVYKDVINNRKLVTPIYTPEDLSRRA